MTLYQTPTFVARSAGTALPLRPVLLLDNYDSFTFNLVQLLGMLGVRCDVVTNDAPEIPRTPEQLAKFSGLVISPGPGAPTGAGECLRLLALAKHSLPILGVCL